MLNHKNSEIKLSLFVRLTILIHPNLNKEICILYIVTV